MLQDPSDFSDMAFTLYAMECEGDLDTYQSKLNRAIRYLSESDDPEDEDNIFCACNRAGLRPGDLGEHEIQHIVTEAKQWQF